MTCPTELIILQRKAKTHLCFLCERDLFYFFLWKNNLFYKIFFISSKMSRIYNSTLNYPLGMWIMAGKAGNLIVLSPWEITLFWIYIIQVYIRSYMLCLRMTHQTDLGRFGVKKIVRVLLSFLRNFRMAKKAIPLILWICLHS